MIHSCRLAVLMLAGWLLAACAQVNTEQAGHQVRFIAGSLSGEARWRDVRDVAPFHAQYAVLAALAYDDDLYGLKTGHRSGVESCSAGDFCDGFPNKFRQFRQIWGHEPLIARINDCSVGPDQGGRRDFDHLGQPGTCNVEQPGRHRVLDGLGIQIWVRRADRCGEMVVAFRGTDFHQSDDWLSNFRWVTRVLPLHDQYEQAREHVDRLIAQAIAKTGCKPRTLTTVGHSLGGGLAQHAAYAQLPPKGRVPITRVYAFNPSFVTGYSDRALQGERLVMATRSLRIDRVYEHGEILAYPRFILRNLIPPTPCSPQIRLIRYNLITGSIVHQHRMAMMAQRLLHHSPRMLSPRMVDDSRLLPASPEALETDGSCRATATAG